MCLRKESRWRLCDFALTLKRVEVTFRTFPYPAKVTCRMITFWVNESKLKLHFLRLPPVGGGWKLEVGWTIPASAVGIFLLYIYLYIYIYLLLLYVHCYVMQMIQYGWLGSDHAKCLSGKDFRSWHMPRVFKIHEAILKGKLPSNDIHFQGV